MDRPSSLCHQPLAISHLSCYHRPVAIRASSSKQIDSLIADLSAASGVTRETAVARLTLLGARAVERLLTVAASHASADARTAAWRTLEAIADQRALDPALETIASPT